MRMRKFLSYLLVFAMVFGFATNIGVMEAKAEDALNLSVAGEFNGWNNADENTKFTANAEGIYTGTITIPENYEKTITDIQIVSFGSWDKEKYAIDDTTVLFEQYKISVNPGKKVTIEYDKSNRTVKFSGEGYKADTKKITVHYALDTNITWEATTLNAWNIGAGDVSVVTKDQKTILEAVDGWYTASFMDASGGNATNVQPYNMDPETWTSGIEIDTENYDEVWIKVTYSEADGYSLSALYRDPALNTYEDFNKLFATIADKEEITLEDEDTIKELIAIMDGFEDDYVEEFYTGEEAPYADQYKRYEEIKAEYNALVKAKADQDAATAVIDKIKAIGTVALTSASAIADARTAYDALTDEQKKLVSNYETLTAAEAKIKELEDAAKPVIKLHFKNSEKWEKVGIYFTNADWKEITGGWPGSEIKLESGSTTWYEYSYFGTETSFNYIFNNLSTDDATKAQTVNTEKVAAGEYWITLGDKVTEGDDKDKFKVNVTTTAPADYDGKGALPKEEANWTEAKSKIEEAAKTATDDKAATAEVDMKDSTKVPADVLGAMKDKNIDVSFKMGDLVWTINGKSIKDASKELNIGAVLNATAIDAKKVEKLASTIKCAKAIQLSLAHNGDFGAKLNLKSTLGKDYAGKFAVLYYYNPTADKFEYQQYVKIDAEGCATFAFDHASDYVIAITDDVVAKSVGAKTADTATTAGMVLMMLIASAGVVFVSKKRKMFA